MRVAVRGDVPVVTLTFDSILPEGNELVEAVRIQTSVNHLHSMADALSKTVEQIKSGKHGAS